MAELSAAERYALSRTRAKNPVLESFRARREFDLDPFQISAAAVLESGNSVLVAAPTGAGKTVVAEFAVYLAMQQTASKIFYTTPMKALSNQKFNEFVEEWGADNVGILTGDTNINPDARIVVMTTEVLRNMLYAESSSLDELMFVVMDEIHFLADRFRGAVWEEVILHLPQHVRIVGLSATVSNAEEFGDWLEVVRGNTEIIVSEDRPIPLDQHVLMGANFVDLFESHGAQGDVRVNPEVTKLAHSLARAPHIRRGGGSSSGRSGRGNRGGRTGFTRELVNMPRMDRPEVISLLGQKNLLPAIFFVFSRAGCEQAVSQCLRAGVKLTTPQEAESIRRIVDDRCGVIPDEDLGVLGYFDWVDALQRGVAAHHAGLLPLFKEVVEELFQKKLVKVVFATETLALGINMPARTVVLEKLEKFNGESRVQLTPGEYTQLTGRAGRRGIDVEGHSLIQWSAQLEPNVVASLASKRTYPLHSSFKPTYNMAINLIERFGRDRTRDVLESSFAQFQADKSVVGIARKVAQKEQVLAGYAKPMECHLGDFAEYAALRRKLSDVERSSDSGSRAAREKKNAEASSLRKKLKSHSCHHCADREEHARWAERWWRERRECDKLIQEINTRTNAVARVFDRVCDVLLELDYLVKDPQGEEFAITPQGDNLARIYGERDLLIAESLRRGLWNNLDAPSLAAMCATIVYEARREEGDFHERHLPRGAYVDALNDTVALWGELDELEHQCKLPGTEPLSLGFALPLHKWASGQRLSAVLRDADMPAGDFVRWAKQTIDLLDQLIQIAPRDISDVARVALDSVKRGIVAYSAVI